MSRIKKRKIAEVSQDSIIDLTRPDVVVLSDDEDGIEFLSTSRSVPLSGAKAAGKSINDILRDKIQSSSVPKQLPPLQLTTPEQVAKHTPCSLHFDILPPELAERLFRALLRESVHWQRNKWYLADREVTSPHTTKFYAEQEGADISHWYMGRQVPSDGDERATFIPEMLEARDIIQTFVNEQLDKRTRYDLEFAGPWRANVAAANCYKGAAETVGAHADQLTYLGPYPTIASLSLGVVRNFRLRAVPSLQDPDAPPPRTFDVMLPHNSLCIMGAGCQEKFKHSIPPARSIDIFKLKREDGTTESYVERINVTFRFYRPDFVPSTTPKCHCGIPCILRADAKGKAASHLASNGVPDRTMRFFWQCFAGAQNEGKRCSFFKILDMDGEGRGPCLGKPTGS